MVSAEAEPPLRTLNKFEEMVSDTDISRMTVSNFGLTSGDEGGAEVEAGTGMRFDRGLAPKNGLAKAAELRKHREINTALITLIIFVVVHE